jgi:hypothetical protein
MMKFLYVCTRVRRAAPTAITSERSIHIDIALIYGRKNEMYYNVFLLTLIADRKLTVNIDKDGLRIVIITIITGEYRKRVKRFYV